jgi:hypothetical protein
MASVEQTSYLQGQDFETAKRNSPYYAVADFSVFQGGTVLAFKSLEGEVSGSFSAVLGGSKFPFDALTENRAPIVAPRRRPKFRQRTFPGKPLLDDAVIHANRVASDIDDSSILDGRFGK